MKSIGRKILKLRRFTLSGMLKFTGLTTSLFIFQACYGTPNDLPRNYLQGNVKSSESDSAILGLQVMLIDPETRDTLTNYTDEYGQFSFPGYGAYDSSLIINVQDVDGAENGNYAEKQIVLDPKQQQVSIDVDPVEAAGK